jgi:flagellar biogenesis protein FliO
VGEIRKLSAGWLLLAGSLLPAWGAPAARLPASPLPDQTFTVVRMFGAFIFVVALFLCGVWLWRNWQRLLAKSGQAPKLRVVEARSLGGRHTLYVVRYEQARWMLAASPTGVSLLAQLPAAGAPEIPAAEDAPPAFAAKLHQLLARP